MEYTVRSETDGAGCGVTDTGRSSLRGSSRYPYVDER